MERKNYQKPLNLEERKEIERLVKGEYSFNYIANQIGRSKNCVVVEIKRAGGRKAYCAQEAHKGALERKAKQTKKVSKVAKEQTAVFQLTRRIENLEMQLEILHEAIKGLIKK